MQRRQFLLFILGGGMGVPGLCSGQTLGRSAPAPESRLSLQSIETAIEQLLFDPAGARAIGRRYLERFPERANPALLLEHSGLAMRQNPPPGGGAGSKTAIDQRRRQDFLAGNTVILEGWILAQSEASLCALLALSP
ncbi:hypothetical protein [Marinobacterium aestuariivivens]|uniref:SnoaL-like domain-containing protein n=1 Tax=Marinobacterium aestuariivivens TaxID=1698799 RepID=A0ABW2A3F7_9GAMM